MKISTFVFASALLWSLQAFAFELTPQLGHNGWVAAVAFSPDGKYVVSGASDKQLKLWELSSGKEIRTFFGHTAQIYSVEFSPDGKQLLSRSEDSTARVWSVNDAKELQTFRRDDGDVGWVAFSANGKYVVSTGRPSNNYGGALPAAKFWEIATGKEVTPPTTERSFGAGNFSRDGQHYVTSYEKTLRVVDVASGKIERTLDADKWTANDAAFSPDGKTIASVGTEKSVKLWDAATGKLAREFDGHTKFQVNTVAYSPDGKFLVSGGQDHMVRLWEIATGKELRVFKGHTFYVQQVVFSPDGKQIASAGQDDTLRIWDVASGAQLRTFSARTTMGGSVVFSPDGKHVAGSGDRAIQRWDVQGAKEIRPIIRHPSGAFAATYSPDGRYLAAAHGDHAVRLWDVSSGKLVRDFETSTGWSLDFSTDGKLLVAAGYMSIWIGDVATGKPVRFIKAAHEDTVYCVAFAHDSKRVVSAGGKDKTAKVWDVEDGKEVFSLLGHTDFVGTVAYSSDGKLIASGSNDKTVKLWDAATGRATVTLTGHSDHVTSVAFSPDGKQVASSSADKTVRLWDAATGKQLRVFSGHQAGVGAVTFRPDGKYLASASGDGAIRLWRIDTGDSMAMVSSTGGEWLLYTDDGLFDSSPGGVELVAAVDRMHGYNIDQLALKNNRPDLILTRMGLGSAEMNEYYQKKYLNRLRKAGIDDERKLSGSFENLPVSTVVESKASGAEHEVAITLEDKVALESYQVYVNGVPLYAGFGKKISGKRQQLREKIACTEGQNRVEVSAMNSAGQESFRALEIITGPATMLKDLYFVGFGVSDYADNDIPDLTYANKDADELGKAFAKLKGYDNRYIKTYTNQQVTKESIAAAKEFFAKAKPQDTIVLFIAGHGMHDHDALATYYYVIHGTQIEASEAGGLGKIDPTTAVSFEEIESLLAATTAKQKLFLMDTCESGEREASDVVAAAAGAGARSLHARGLRRVKAGAASDGVARPWLLDRDRYIYQDLAKRTGALVFSSSKGGEYSYESAAVQNGLFTEAILKGLSKKADTNKDGQISTQELRVFVTQDVGVASGDLQHPTVDRDNLSLRLYFVL